LRAGKRLQIIRLKDAEDGAGTFGARVIQQSAGESAKPVAGLVIEGNLHTYRAGESEMLYLTAVAPCAEQKAEARRAARADGALAGPCSDGLRQPFDAHPAGNALGSGEKVVVARGDFGHQMLGVGLEHVVEQAHGALVGHQPGGRAA
jgi:hypothetical protein